MDSVKADIARNATNNKFICRRCAVFKSVETVTFEGPTMIDTQRLVFQHLIECHPIRAEELLVMFGNLLMVTNDYAWSALRDHNSEGDFNIQNVRLDRIKRDQELFDAAISVRINEVLKEQ